MGRWTLALFLMSDEKKKILKKYEKNDGLGVK